MPPDRAPDPPPVAPLGDWGDFPPAPPAPPAPFDPIEAELVEPADAEAAAFRALIDEIEGLPPLDAVEIVDPPLDAAPRALIDEIEGAPPAPGPVAPDWLDSAPPAPKPRPRAMPVAPAAPPDPQLVSCPRCGETGEPVANRCPWCGKWLVGPPPEPEPAPAPEPDDTEPDWYADARTARTRAYTARERADAGRDSGPPPLVVVFVTYGLLLASLIGMGAFAVATRVRNQEELNVVMFVVGVIDTGLVLGALALVRRQTAQPQPSAFAAAWLLALPGLAVLLTVNVTYISFLREILRPFGAAQPEKVPLTLATVFLVCVIPAFMEELFFRQVMLGAFRRAMSLNSAVWLTAGLFALAHLANPLGMPYLVLAGAAFGYARAFGGLPLAMVLHFLHNFAVVALEAWH